MDRVARGGYVPSTMEIRRFAELAGTPGLTAALDGVFFGASSVQSFRGDTEKAAFRELWLGRYLDRFPQWAYVAVAADGSVLGYLVGATEDPARSGAFDDVAYFAALAPHTARYPAHLHINLAEQARGGGIGSALVARFIADLAAAGVEGVHVVTGAGMRNVRFYERLGFCEVARLPYKTGQIVMLARATR